ncbi:MAG: enoyl-CoA hydratase/isomerase family protein [Pseudomonadota bacterium]
MAPDQIHIEKNPTRWRVTLNRPRKANAITHAMLEQLHDLFVRAGENHDLRTLVITGAGERVFCGGADLQEVSDKDDPRDALWDSMSEALVKIPAFTVAQINGHCIGGGLVLALCCDVRVSVPAARFAYPALRMGALPGKLDARRLHHLIGSARTSLLLLGDQQIEASEAYKWGLIDRVVAPDALEDSVDAICLTANQSDPTHLHKLTNVCRDVN